MGRKGKEKILLLKKAPNLLNPYFGWVLSLYLARAFKDQKKGTL